VTYTYDADGRRVKKVEDGQTTVYLGNTYEKNPATGVVTTYYYAGAQRIAQRQGDTVSYFVGDNLGSTSVTTDASGAEVGRQRYYPYGAPRFQSGVLRTDYRFTGQRSEEAKFGSLYDYGARFYSPYLNRCIQPDSIIPDPGNPQGPESVSFCPSKPLLEAGTSLRWTAELKTATARHTLAIPDHSLISRPPKVSSLGVQLIVPCYG
jgi:RHS repeat-associated protein